MTHNRPPEPSDKDIEDKLKEVERQKNRDLYNKQLEAEKKAEQEKEEQERRNNLSEKWKKYHQDQLVQSQKKIDIVAVTEQEEKPATPTNPSALVSSSNEPASMTPTTGIGLKKGNYKIIQIDDKGTKNELRNGKGETYYISVDEKGAMQLPQANNIKDFEKICEGALRKACDAGIMQMELGGKITIEELQTALNLATHYKMVLTYGDDVKKFLADEKNAGKISPQYYKELMDRPEDLKAAQKTAMPDVYKANEATDLQVANQYKKDLASSTKKLEQAAADLQNASSDSAKLLALTAFTTAVEEAMHDLQCITKEIGKGASNKVIASYTQSLAIELPKCEAAIKQAIPTIKDPNVLGKLKKMEEKIEDMKRIQIPGEREQPGLGMGPGLVS